jgi:ornithine cyclodeaminase/alanine dehydrogenase
MATPLPPLRYLSADDVRAAMPPVDERLRLAESVLTALATPGAAELPPKIGVHPRAPGSFAHAMPAFRRGKRASQDQLGMKWVAGSGVNRERGLPAITALVILNDPETGIPIAIVDGAPITAERTAAVSGVAIRRFAPAVSGRPVRAAIVGAGIQGHSHVPVLAHVLPGVELTIHDRHPERAAELADVARATPGIGSAEPAGSPERAVHDADVVVTAASFTDRASRQRMPPDWLAPASLVVAVDYATLVSAAVAREAAPFLVDHVEQFLANREAGQFDGYPEPDGTLGAAILAGEARPPGRVLVTHLGVGLADVVFGAAILEQAIGAGLGRQLPR